MADEKKPKKKKPTDPAAAASGGIPVAPPRPPLDDVDSHEYADAVRAALSGAKDNEQSPEVQQEPPERSFWQTLLHGGQSDKGFIGGTIEEARSVARGVVGGIAEGISGLKPHGMDRVAVRSDVDPETVDRSPTKSLVDTKRLGAGIKAGRDKVLGKRSDDPIAGFVESVSQFTTGFIAARGMGTGRAAIYGRGAAADMFAFDPYEASIAELAAGAPKWTGLHLLGELLSVDGDDSELVARIKRGTEGVLIGAGIDKLIAVTRSVRAGKAAASAKDPAEKAALEVKSAQEAAKAQAYHEGTLGTTEPVVARPAADGDGWELVNVQSLRRKAAEKMDPTLAEELRIAKEEAVTDHMTGVPNRRALDAALARAEADPNLSIVVFDANNFKHVNKLMGDDAGDVAIKDVAGAIRQAAEEAGVGVRSVFRRGGDEFTVIAPNDIADKVRARAEEIYGTRQYGETEVSLTGSVGENYRAAGAPLQAAKAARKAGVAPSPSAASEGAPGSTAGPSLKVKDAAEAQVLAAEMNHGLRERTLAAKGMNPEQTAAGFAKMRALIANNDLAGIKSLMEESDHFNVSYMDGEKESLAAIEMVSRMWKGLIDEGQARGQKVEDIIRAAREGLGLMTESQAHRAVVKDLDAQKGQSIRNLAADMYLKWRGQKLAGLASRMDARPHDNILIEEFREGYLKLLETQRALAAANSEAGRNFRMMQERNNPLTEGAAPRPDGSPAAPKDAAASPSGTKGTTDTPPIDPAIAKAPWMQEDLATYVAGMKVREIRAVATMVRLADGKPRNLYAVAHSARVIQETGFTKGALELFINNILSGVKTALTAGISGALVTGLDVAGKIGGGLARRDMAQAREGYDLGVSLIGEVNDSLKGMVAAIKLGRSVINPMPRHIVIGGITGELVRGQGRLLIGADEFVVVANYRARVRAKSLRMGRADGLEGEALLARVERDLEAAYDKETGMATLSEPLEAGDRAAMRTPLGDDTHGGKLHNYVSGEDWAKWVAPFVRTSVNLWRTGVETTPVLNLLYKKNREIMARGGPEAAELHARSVIAGTVYAAMFMYGKDNVTGRGPSDPALRKLWRGKDGRSHQPYSIRVGGKWISYRRGDPLGMMIGMTADLRTMIHEIGNDDPTVAEFATSIVAAIASNLSSKTHMAGITLATDAFSSNDGPSMERWLSGIASGLAVPSAVAQFNDDGTMREVQSIGDAIINRIPGWSKTLDPRFNMFGEPELKAAGTMNRNVNPFTFVDAGRSVEDDLFLLGKGFSSPSRTETIGGAKVDFGDRQKWDNGSGKSPYVRWMELIRDQDLRSDMEKLVRSERWKRPSGTGENPGGRRWDMASGIKEAAYQKALAKVLREYPLLKDHRRMLMKRDAAAYRGGEAGVEKFDANQALKSLGN